MLSTLTPDRSEFSHLAQQYRVVPVTLRLLAEEETPLSVYRKLAGGTGSFLLESAEPERSWSRYSFIGVESATLFTERDGHPVWDGMQLSSDPLVTLESALATLTAAPLENLPPLAGGFVGYWSYDSVRRVEKLPDSNPDELRVPEMEMFLVTDLAVVDHHTAEILLIANAVLPASVDDSAVSAAYSHAEQRLSMMVETLKQPAVSSITQTLSPPSSDELASRTQRRSTAEEYCAMVEKATDAIHAGECFQIVPSQRFSIETSANALDIYRALRRTNPSPYMYLLNCEGFEIIGSSPEAHLKIEQRRALLRPIAGTAPRGASSAEDALRAQALLDDPKEMSEHVMLVDLARNDLGRVCETGSIEVAKFTEIEHYSHVMHIVSTVTGQMRAECSAVDALAATFPAGTLTGAPKVRAMEIIDELEPVRRGVYGGVVGYFDLRGDVDVAIAIRTALLKDGVAYVQAGAGVVADSVPEKEEAETRHKAAGVLSAILAAENLQQHGQL